MKIVITGSLGHIGKPLTISLVEKGHEVVVVSSSNERKLEIEKLKANAAIGSVDDVSFLTECFKGADSIFIMVPPNFSEDNQVEYYSRVANAYKDAIIATNVKRVINLSSYGAHLNKGTGFILGAYYTEQILNKLENVSLTHVRPGYFYYNLFGFMGMIRDQGIMGSNFGGEDKLTFVSPKDIAEIVSEELQQYDGEHIRYVVSDVVSAVNVAKVIGEAIGKPDLAWITFTNRQTYDALTQIFPKHVADNFVQLGHSLHAGLLTEHYFAEGHKPIGKIKLKEFAQEFAQVYHSTNPEV